MGRVRWDGETLSCSDCLMEYDPKRFAIAEKAADIIHDECRYCTYLNGIG